MANDHAAATANTPASVVNSASVVLFQKAHAKMVTLQRVDEQLQSLLDQRRKLQDELRGVQALINEEFDRVVREGRDDGDRQICNYDISSNGNANGNGKAAKRIGNPKNDTIRLEVAEAV